MHETLLAFDPLGSAGPATVWVVVLAFVFLECAFVIGLFLPGDSLLLAAGVVLAAHDHELSAWLLSGVAVLLAVAGNQVGYLVGRFTGARLKLRKGGRILSRENLDRAGVFLDRWGFWSIVVARWVPWVRTLAPLIAGAARMDNRKFVLANLVGAVIWVPALVLLGFYGAGLLDRIPWVKDVAVVASVGFFVVGTIYGAVRYVQEIRKPVDEVDATGTSSGEQPPPAASTH
ncbi:DedA family protein [Pseudonocardia xishanensis]|uniref:DedA family protein n=1 Tax=Pseudonocardia xishanensis TaxID=630995 RepID=A0ABP8RLR6_9PSEU